MKVVKVSTRSYEKPIPVYDISVERTHNFCLASGIVVHNSKDCADAVCGAYSTLITRSASWHMPPGIEDEGYTADRFDEDRMDAGRA